MQKKKHTFQSISDEEFASVFHLLKNHTDTLMTPLDQLKIVRANSPFRTLIQTILTAQTKDSLTAPISKKLFESVGDTVETFLTLDEEQLANLIKPVSYYKTKAKHILQTVRIIQEHFNGQVPKTFDQLLTLPGVGPKTANLILNDAYNIPAIVVDIHVFRISQRIGYIQASSRADALNKLQKKLPVKYWADYNTVCVKHGQTLCKAVRPMCNKCPVSHLCKKNIVQVS